MSVPDDTVHGAPGSPKLWLLTRHAGALAWLRETLMAPHAYNASHLSSLDGLCPGDTVAGSLPLRLAADLCARGVVVLVIDMSLSASQREGELSAAQMRAAGARLTRYRVSAEPWSPCMP